MNDRVLERLSLPLVLWGLALGGAGAIIMQFGVPLSRNASLRVEQLRPMSAAALQVAPPGIHALVEGTIDTGNPLLDHGFVAFRHEQYRKMYDLWDESTVHRPSLLLAVPDGYVRITEGSYRMEHPRMLREDSLNRFEGFQPGDTVLAVGRVEGNGESVVLRAELLYGGTQARYLDEQRRDHRLYRWLGPVLLCSGGMLVLLAVVQWFWRRRRRRPGLTVT
jgi:hypothetical protein